MVIEGGVKELMDVTDEIRDDIEITYSAGNEGDIVGKESLDELVLSKNWSVVYCLQIR